MNKLYGRPRPARQHHQQQPFWPRYTLPAVAQHAAEAHGNPPAFIPGTNMPQQPFERTVMSGYGSYYQSTPNYWRNPVPYTQSDIGAPVPGWGTSVRVAGPPRVGVGQVTTEARRFVATPTRLALLRKIAADIQRTEGGGAPEEPPPAEEPTDIVPPEASKVGGIDWYWWPIGVGVVLIGVGYYGTTKGWF